VRLARRITAGVALLLLSSGASVGVLAARISWRAGIEAIDERLADVVDAVSGASDPVGEVFALADRSAAPIAVSLFYDDTDPVAIIESPSSPLMLVTGDVAVVVSAADSAQDAVKRVRIRSVPLGDGEWLVVGESRSGVDDVFARSVAGSVAAALTVALVAAVLAWTLVRRTLAPVRDATAAASRIAAGELNAPLPVGGAAEIGELADALRRMVAVLRDAAETRADSERLMREFLGDASHELRTPLTVITGYVDILASDRPVDAAQRARALGRLRTESLRMDGIIRDVLMLAEMEAVQVSLDEEIDLGELTAEHFGDLMDQQPERPVALMCQSVRMRGSRPHLARLVANIVSNVQRHTDVMAAVSVTVVREMSDAVLTVDDAGPGLPVAMYERAATSFERFDRSRSTGAGGFGLGLGVVAGVVRLHGGTLALQRGPLGGLRTVVRFPVV